MRLLPNLFTTAGVLALPWSDRTADQLVVALLTEGGARRCELFAEALNQDPPFALWAVCRAAQAGQSEIRAAGELAAWLSAGAVAQLSLTADEVSAVPLAGSAEKWADLAALSIVVARLSARIAETAHIDRRRAYFLGLLHAALQWAIGSGTSQPPPAPVLPGWLVDAVAAIRASKPQHPASEVDCVAMALAIATNGPSSIANVAGFDFDPPEYLAQLSEERQTWIQSSPRGDLLRPLVSHLARLEKLEQQFQSTLEREKLDALKELAYGAGHEINNPLANISARAQTLLQDERDPERRRKLAAINTQAFRAHEMIADMMLFARPPQPKLSALDLVPLVVDLVAELSPMASEQNTQLDFHVPTAPVMARADKTQIAVAVRALCINALEALVTGGHVEVALCAAAPCSAMPAELSSSSQTVQITVSDNGPGISTETRRHIFDPFYSGREAGRGLGFGLSKCWRIASMHGGRIDVESAPGQGARFTITLPVDRNR